MIFKSEHDDQWNVELERAENESTQPLSAVEHTHLLALSLSPMGSLTPTAVVSNLLKNILTVILE